MTAEKFPDGHPAPAVPVQSAPRWLAVAEEAFVPADAGGRVESLNMLRAARAAGLDLHVLVPGVDAAELAAHEAALPGVTFEAIPRRTGPLSHLSLAPYLFASRPMPPGLPDRLHREHAAAPFTAVLAVSFRVAHLAVALAEALDLPAVVRPHNVESQYFRQIADGLRLPRNLPWAAEAWKLRRAEPAIHASDRVVLFAEIAEADVAVRQARTRAAVVHVPPFLPPVQHAGARRAPAEPGRGTLLFLGALDSANNVGGIRWFAAECWPGLRASHPGAGLHVVGRRAADALRRELEEAGARVTVDAPEVASHLAAADVFVNPVQYGAGINIKMVEAMAAGLAVVTTPVGARGLHWRHGEHLVVAESPQEFRSAVAALLDDPARRAEIAEAGRRFVEKQDGATRFTQIVEAVGAAAR